MKRLSPKLTSKAMAKQGLVLIILIIGLVWPSVLPDWPKQAVNMQEALALLPARSAEVTRLPAPPALKNVLVGGDITDPPVKASLAAVIDAGTGVMLWSKGGDKQWPLASITKLMTASVLWDRNLDWRAEVDMEELSSVAGGKRSIYQGERVALEILWNVMLVASDNYAAMQLVRSSGLSDQQFVLAMNQKAKDWGLKQTRFVEPTGLSPDNTSTVEEAGRLAYQAFQLSKVRAAASSGRYQFAVGKTVRTVDNTNPLVGKLGSSIVASKTGYIPEAGGNVVAILSPDNIHEVIAVVLGDSVIADRVNDLTVLADWVRKEVTWNK
ncbi:MAG: serine hydrolase [bacterium]